MEVLGLAGFAEVACSRCSHSFLIDATDLDVDAVGSDERKMGPETFYHGVVALACTECGNDVEITYEASEYPIGALNHSEVTIVGGQLSKDFREPSVRFEKTLYSLDDETRVYLPDEKPIVTSLARGVSDLMAAISASPELIYQIDPRQFEEIVAEVFAAHHFQVELTPRTRDGGRDIIAIRSTLGVKSKYIIECKRYAKSNLVGVGLVRSLYGVQVQEGANKSILATTSSFTAGALDFANGTNTTKWGMDLKAYEDIIHWVRTTHHNRK